MSLPLSAPDISLSFSLKRLLQSGLIRASFFSFSRPFFFCLRFFVFGVIRRAAALDINYKLFSMSKRYRTLKYFILCLYSSDKSFIWELPYQVFSGKNQTDLPTQVATLFQSKPSLKKVHGGCCLALPFMVEYKCLIRPFKLTMV